MHFNKGKISNTLTLPLPYSNTVFIVGKYSNIQHNPYVICISTHQKPAPEHPRLCSATPPSTVTAAAVVWSCDAYISDTTKQRYRSALTLPLSAPPHALLSVWRTARGPLYCQTWEMVLLAAVTAGCLPVQRPTVCPTNHKVSIHDALSSTRLQHGLA